MKLKTLLVSIGLGAGVMYFLDPQHGERRRTMVRERANDFVNNINDSIDMAVENARMKTRGVLTEMTAKLGNEGTTDWILEERVRNNLGRMARGVNIAANAGRITLTGPVLRENADTIVNTAMRTRGVYGVENQLDVFDNPQDIPSLEGASSGLQTRPALSPTTRVLSSVGGSLLTLYGLTRRGVAKPVLSTAGLVLTARGVTNLDTRSLLGLGENGIRVNKSINIFAPIDEVYRFWRNFENFPLFMNHVKEIMVQDDVSTWKVAGPAGVPVEFQSRITQDVPNDVIAWETLPDSQVQNTGMVRFEQNRDDSTRVTVQMTYVPPAGAVGHAVAQLFGVDPRQAMNDDLMRLKALLEGNRTSTETSGTNYSGSENL
jgi:uncharacterized membrane protein